MLPALILMLACGRSDPLKVALSPDSTAPLQVWAFTSADGEGWTRSEAPIAHSFSSLGLRIDEGGAWIVTGLQSVSLPTWWEERFPSITARALTWSGQDWGSMSWEVEDDGAVSAIDPQWLGDELWYFAPQGRKGDPAAHGGTHQIRSSPPSRTRFEGPGLADPSPVLFQGALHLFATQHPGRVLHAFGADLSQTQVMQGVTVPFAVVVDEELWLLAQVVSGGKRVPAVRKSTDGQSWNRWQVLVDVGDLDSCTSPVMGPVSQGWMLLCVEERQL